MKEVKKYEIGNYILRFTEDEVELVNEKTGKKEKTVISYCGFSTAAGNLVVQWRMDNMVYELIKYLVDGGMEMDKQMLDMLLTNILTVCNGADIVGSFRMKRNGRQVTDGLQYSVMNALINYQKRLSTYSFGEDEEENARYETYERAKAMAPEVMKEMDEQEKKK